MNIESFRQVQAGRTAGRTNISISWAPVGAKNQTSCLLSGNNLVGFGDRHMSHYSCSRPMSHLVSVLRHVLHTAPGHGVQAEHVTRVVRGVGQLSAAATHQELGVNEGGHMAPPNKTTNFRLRLSDEE